ncbi:MAG: undecaprenyl-diphosphate phosphatase [Ruminococcaceae bacterium]|nr:undecaprenyl-diphosphate phosphatase [Oscillospiraceae bacterium]
MLIIELLKSLLYGIVEGITEWLPVSSTGHLILFGELLPLRVSDSFSEMYDVVIQLGAILAVIVLFFHKLNPIAPSKTTEEKKVTWSLWAKVCVAVIPSAIIGLVLDDWLDTHLYNYITVAVTLILYGILFIVIEKLKPSSKATIPTVEGISYKTAFFMGAFQMLALIPGTSRSGSTILGGMLLGLSRSAAAEFSFFMAIPTMLGASLLKVVKLFAEGVTVTSLEWGILAVGCISAFIVSLCAIKFLMDFVKRHSFSVFGVYRILLGVLVLGYFFFAGR